MLTDNARDAVREHYQARNYDEVVRTLSEVPRAALLEVPEHAYMLADAARRVGGYPDILPLTSDVVEVARAQDDKATLCRALNLQGVLLLEQGQRQAAERAWFELVAVATSADDPQFVARASNNLGVSAILDMRLETAITNFQRAISAYVRIGWAHGCAQAHQNLGIVFRELDHVQESHAHFQHAMTFARTADCIDDVARAEHESALLMVYARENLVEAEQAAQRALDIFSQLKQPAGTAETFRVLGVVAMAREHFEEAQHQFDSAFQIARELKLRLLEGETLLGLSRLARLRHDPPGGYQREQVALEIFREMSAEPWGAQVRKRMDSLP